MATSSAKLLRGTILLCVWIAAGCSSSSSQPDGAANSDGHVTTDGGETSDASSQSDQASVPDPADPASNDRFVKLVIYARGESRLAAGATASAMGVGTAVSLQAFGVDVYGRAFPVSGATYSTTTPELVRITSQTVGAETVGITVVGLTAGRASITATAPTSTIALQAQLALDVVAPESVSLVASTVPDAPFFGFDDRFPNGTPGQATAPIDMPVRVFVKMVFVLKRASDGAMIVGQDLLDPKDLQYTVMSGPATIGADGVLHGTDIGTVTVQVAVVGADLAAVAPAQAIALFTSDTPAVSLGTYYVNERMGLERALGHSRRAGNSPLLTTLSPDLAFLDLEQVLPGGRLLVATDHIGEGVQYRRWIAPANYTVRTSGDSQAASVDADGTVHWLAPGVAMWTVTAAELDAPVLLRANYPASVVTSLRITPDMLAFQIPSPTQTCQRVKGFVTVSGVERELSPFEALALYRTTEDWFYGPQMIANASTPLEFCPPTQIQQGSVSPVMGSFRLQFLPQPVQAPTPVSFRVTF